VSYATALLISVDPSLIETIQPVVRSVAGLQLVVASPSDVDEGFLDPVDDLALLMLHVSDKKAGAGPDRMITFLRQTLASHQPVATVILSDNHCPQDAFSLLRLGAADYLSRPLDLSRLSFLVDMLTVRARFSARQSASAPGIFGGEPAAMQRLMEQVRQVAPQDTTLLLGGETGSGKTRLARVIHEHSSRAQQPFLGVNCGALSANLIESEMFGHIKGAFTGADRQRVGKFAEVGSGTLLLDEVDALAPPLQAKLLRAVDERVFEPVGSNQTMPVKARLIAATNRDLAQEVKEGRFRADLYYRLNVVSFYLPPLRERRESIPVLASRFAEEFAESHKRPVRTIDPLALQALENHSWPGNIRELRNVIERGVVLCTTTSIRLEDLPADVAGEMLSNPPVQPQPIQAEADPAAATLTETRGLAEVVRIQEALRRSMNNRARAAAELGISRMTLYNKLHKYGLLEP
jgi:DNA-binding NtrC family response regulator